VLHRTAGDDGGRRGMVGDGGGQHNVVRPGPGLLLVGQVLEKTGRDDEMSSVLVLPRCEHCSEIQYGSGEPALRRCAP